MTGQVSAERSVVAHALAWWRDARRRWNNLHQLSMLPDHEVSRIAGEVGMNAGDFMRVAEMPDGAAQLLDRRLAALKLQPDEIREISGLLLADLQRTCSMCADKARCADDMAVDPLAAGWQSYCPNAGNFETLK